MCNVRMNNSGHQNIVDSPGLWITCMLKELEPSEIFQVEADHPTRTVNRETIAIL